MIALMLVTVVTMANVLIFRPLASHPNNVSVILDGLEELALDVRKTQVNIQTLQ